MERSILFKTLFLFFILPLLLNARVSYYVDDDIGSDLADGSFAAPFRTLQKASDVMYTNTTTATCYIYPGSYSEQVEIFSNKNANFMVFTALSNTLPVLDGGLASNYAFFLTNAANIIFTRMIFKRYTYAISMWGTSTNNYFIRNTFYSNDEYGLFIRDDGCDRNHILTNDMWGPNSSGGIYLQNGDYNIIMSNYIHNNGSLGIFIPSGSSCYNQIVKNAVWANGNWGIYFWSSTANNNYCLSNNIWNNTPGGSGLRISDGDSNVYAYNRLYNNWIGIYVDGSPEYCYFAHNTIFSNNIYGIDLISGGIDYNRFASNHISATPNSGIHIDTTDNCAFYSNWIHHNLDGVSIDSGSTNIVFIRNVIYSNERSGISVSHEQDDRNSFISNIIWGENQDCGISITNGDNNKVYRNLIYNISNFGIYIGGDAMATEIVNNTIFNSTRSNGILFSGSSEGFLYNNIILSNGNGSGDYGVRNQSSGSVSLAYNCIFGNTGGYTNGNFSWGNGNIFLDPILDQNYFIADRQSPAIDSGTNMAGVSDIYSGDGPDMGWKESDLPEEEENIILPEIAAVYPNYISLAKGQRAKIVFGKSCEAEIFIYDIFGHLVKFYPRSYYEKGDMKEWDGTIKDTLKKVGAGIFIVLIKGKNIEQRLKFFIKK